MNHSPKIFYLVRHGLATHSLHGYGRRKLTAPILPESIPSIQKIAQYLKTVKNSFQVSSEIIRCRHTSAIISQETGKVFTIDKRLNEEYHETIGEIRARVQNVLKDIEKKPEAHIIICTHGAIIAGIKNILINNAFVTKDMTDYSAPGTIIIIEGKKCQILNFN